MIGPKFRISLPYIFPTVVFRFNRAQFHAGFFDGDVELGGGNGVGHQLFLKTNYKIIRLFGADLHVVILTHPCQKLNNLKKIQSSIFIVLLGILGYVSVVIYQLESQKRVLNEELVELSKVKYGLFSVDEWELILSEIITKRINEFDLEDTNQEKIREKISLFLEITVGELEEAYQEEEGFLKRTGASIFDVFGHMERRIPEMTEGIMNFMNDPENREKIKEYLIKKMNEYSEETFSEIDYSLYNRILLEHDASDKETAIGILKSKITEVEAKIRPHSITLYICVALAFILTFAMQQPGKVEFTILTIITAGMLVVGLLLPMINIDARIGEMSFYLMGEEIRFVDQVLYFKSKSILEMVILMLSSSKKDVIMVGFLVLLFSVLFPISKLIGSLVYLFFEKVRENKVVKFLVFRTAKWSMADVMVVAIFMAYIGFSGIVSEQLKDLETIALNVDVLTTNASDLQTGFIIFTSFAVLSTAVSYKLQYHFNRIS